MSLIAHATTGYAFEKLYSRPHTDSDRLALNVLSALVHHDDSSATFSSYGLTRQLDIYAFRKEDDALQARSAMKDINSIIRGEIDHKLVDGIHFVSREISRKHDVSR